MNTALAPASISTTAKMSSTSASGIHSGESTHSHGQSMDLNVFKADGQWHDIGHGIETMAYPYMIAGTFYMRAKEPPAPGKPTQGEQSLTQHVHPAQQIHTEPDETADNQPMS